MDPIAGPVPMLLSVIERLSARLLALDPRTLEAVRAMAGKVVAVELLGLGQTVYFAPSERAVRVVRRLYGRCPRARPRDAARAPAHGAGEQTAAFSGEVEIIGDLQLGRHLQSMLASFDIDWEELLSQYLGDIAAHQIGNVVRGVSGWADEARHTLAQDTVEYLRNEAAILVETREIAAFVDAVDTLRSDVDRLEARFQRIARALGRD